MPSSHVILCCPFCSCPQFFPASGGLKRMYMYLYLCIFMPVWGCICIYVPLYTSSFWMPTSYSIEQMQPTSLSGDQHLCFPNSCYCEQCTNEYCSCMFILLSIFLNINLRNGIWGSKYISVQFSSVQSLSHVQLFATPWTAAHQASPSITNCRSPPKPMSIESMMPSNHLILCRPLLLLLSIFPSIRVFTSGGQSIEVSASTSVLPMNTQHWSPLGWTGCISWQSKGLLLQLRWPLYLLLWAGIP